MKLSRKSKIFLRYLLGPLLLVVLLWVISEELKTQERLPLLLTTLRTTIFETGSLRGAMLLTLLLLLMLLNWSLEAYKWKIAISTLQPVGFFTAFKATLTGVSFSVTLPNRVGEYLGRMLYLNEGNRLKAIPVTVVASLSQLLLTLSAGLISFFYLLPHLKKLQVVSNISFIFFGLGILLLLVLLASIYFKIEGLAKYLNKLISAKWLAYWTEGLAYFTRPHLLQLLTLSALRYGIFILQYAVAFALFNVSLAPGNLGAAVGFCFLLLSIVPNFAIAELGIRGLVGLWVIGIFSENQVGILLATLIIWLVNLILPAVVGALLLLGIRKLYPGFHEKN